MANEIGLTQAHGLRIIERQPSVLRATLERIATQYQTVNEELVTQARVEVALGRRLDAEDIEVINFSAMAALMTATVLVMLPTKVELAALTQLLAQAPASEGTSAALGLLTRLTPACSEVDSDGR